ncbi:hypothetical protein BCR32DRAFT_251198 [Anaeromyces robustus]|uniref:MULE transposase domain-containing protein n=1 Tax=Anaeromyces robustus TaxID=1754192 RepID=A0A1Y1VTD6_9FUNG|nr:hypothetical protein BCR32DRAFT_251198 [Anaeromyces robustus]|eukprot:ORX64275.1 hypothetical protein BCR32DRAFT_251198 [Anaeromyces robustus]
MDDKLKIEISETNRGKEQIIINKKYKYNFSTLKKDNTKVYICTEYRTSNKCKSFIILYNNKEVLKYKSSYNHLEKEFSTSISITKHKIKNEIRKSLIPLDMRPKRIYDEVSQELGFICPEYNSIKSQLSRSRNKQLFPDIKTFEEIPDESEYYRTIRNENFMIFKNSNLVIFQSPFQAKLFSKYKKDIFAVGTFYIASIISYQVFITRTYVTELNGFYTTSFSVLKDKKQSTYEILFEEITKNVIKYNNNIEITPKNFHCDFEKGISNAVKKTFPDINIKYCIWHYKRSLEINKNALCYKEVEDNNILYIYYKAISNLLFINPEFIISNCCNNPLHEYIFDIYNKIKSSCKACDRFQFLKFLEYFKNIYLNNYDIKSWNYYKSIKHITNNAFESFNNYLNNLFAKKFFFFKLIYVLQKEESLYYNDFERRIGGIWNKKKRILGRTEEIDGLIRHYEKLESELIKMAIIKMILLNYGLIVYLI